MSLLARLAELRASRAAHALVQIQQAIDRAVVDPGSCTDDQLERLCILRELAMMQLDRLGPRVRRNRPLRDTIEAACRAYHAWGEQEAGTEQEQRIADELAVRVLELRTVLAVLEQEEQEKRPPAPVVLASIR